MFKSKMFKLEKCPAGEVQVGEPDAATTSSDDITSTLDVVASFLPSSRSS
jgi:hypothetical protein